ncbi:hypothetical protein ACN47E_005691 [Coniothyrium glycines]
MSQSLDARVVTLLRLGDVATLCMKELKNDGRLSDNSDQTTRQLCYVMSSGEDKLSRGVLHTEKEIDDALVEAFDIMEAHCEHLSIYMHYVADLDSLPSIPTNFKTDDIDGWIAMRTEWLKGKGHGRKHVSMLAFQGLCYLKSKKKLGQRETPVVTEASSSKTGDQRSATDPQGTDLRHTGPQGRAPKDLQQTTNTSTANTMSTNESSKPGSRRSATDPRDPEPKRSKHKGKPPKDLQKTANSSRAQVLRPGAEPL